MSRVNNNVQTNTTQQQNQQPQVKQKAGENNSFAQKLNQKPPQQKKEETKTSSQQGKGASIDADKQQASTAMLQRQGAVFGKGGKGTLADLQAQLDAKSGKGKALPDASGQDAVAGALAKDALAGKDGKGLGGKLDDGMLTQAQQDALSGGPGGVSAQIQNSNSSVSGGSQVVEVKGNTIPTAMLDKIVDQARVGVNAKGAPEFQFDLKGDVLGGLQMKISMEDGKLRASFLAENSDVRRFIDGNLQELRKALEDKGINVAELEIRDPRDKQRDQQREQNQKQRQEFIDQ